MDNLHASGARARGGSKAARDFEPHVIHGCDPLAWRTVAKLATKPVSKWGGVELGLFRLGSHDVVGIPECRVHHPSVNAAVEAVQASARKVRNVNRFHMGSYFLFRFFQKNERGFMQGEAGQAWQAKNNNGCP